MDGQIIIEQKGYELIGCQIHYMILTYDPTHDLDLGFSWPSFYIAVS